MHYTYTLCGVWRSYDIYDYQYYTLCESSCIDERGDVGGGYWDSKDIIRRRFLRNVVWSGGEALGRTPHSLALEISIEPFITPGLISLPKKKK
ncbi:unnamed protein product [Fusarium venenatum]|uniref:Uncharacterized protein n=1 Tax=Fusarium venenatum TaxID=56646 RepID=A0A2L2TAQ2_9HYPO|nr:uncharacterized protein FVRRES_01555 [Fusarium venenatum]CEI65043.1 unnamed protein product [Fusarium venenatum]